MVSRKHLDESPNICINIRPPANLGDEENLKIAADSILKLTLTEKQARAELVELKKRAWMDRQQAVAAMEAEQEELGRASSKEPESFRAVLDFSRALQTAKSVIQ